MSAADIERQWSCQLDVPTTFPGGTIQLDAEVIAYITGRAELVIKYPGRLSLDDDITITGATSGFAVRLEGVFVERSDQSFANGSWNTSITATFMEAEFTRTGPAPTATSKVVVQLKAARVIGRVRVGSLSLISRARTGDHRGYVLTASAEFDPAALAVADLLVLLTLAQRCPISAPFEEEHDENGPHTIRLFSNEAMETAAMPLIPRSAAELTRFLTVALPKVAQLNHDYELTKLCGYYALSVQRSYAEEKFLLAGVFMEAFKFYWARNVAGLTVDVKANGLVRGFVKTTLSNGRKIHFTFEELLTQATGHLGLTQTHTFIEDRNALFHTGAPGAAQTNPGGGVWAAIKPELVTLYRQIDDILLTLVGYTGEIHRWDAIDDRVVFPPG